MAVIVMTNQLCILNVLEGNSAISSVLNANEFMYQKFISNPRNLPVTAVTPTVLSPFAIRGPSCPSILAAGRPFYCDKIRHYHTNGPSSWRRESLF